MPDFGSAGLTRGDVTLQLRPVQGREHVGAIVAAVGRIRGVRGTTESRFAGGELTLVVHVGRPVTLAAELRRVFHRHLVSCTVQDGRFAVELTATAHRAVPEEPQATRPTDLAMPGPLAAVTRPSRPAPPPPIAVDPRVPAVDVMVGALQSMTDVSILVFDDDLRYRAVTGRAHARPDHSAEEMVGRTANEVMTEAEWERFGAAFRAALAGTTTVLEFDAVDGETLYESTCSPVLSGELVVGGMLVTRDVTARRRDQMLISELKEVFELTFDHSPICQALLSPAGEWLRVNAALLALLGREESSLAGRPAREITHPDDRGNEEALIDELLAGRRTRYALQKRFIRADGRTVPVQLRMSAVRADDGVVRGLIAQILDADVLGRGADGPGDAPLAMH
jgi:PAS domain S-box-containing protein